jgi:glycosyltransferase involved in cell wall biosynthesis
MNSPVGDFNELCMDEKSGFVYVGLLSNGRGVEFLLHFFERYSDLEFTVIGDGVLTELVKEYAYKYSNIRYIPALQHDQLMIELSKFKYGFCFIPKSTSLSDYYSLPNKVFEYIFSGIFVFATDLPEVNNLLKITNSGICVNFDIDDLNFKVRNPPDLHINYEKLNDYSWAMQERRLISSYRKLLS